MTDRRHECWSFAIFGGTGDLARRKLLPALSVLRRHEFMCPDCAIIGIARESSMNDASYRDLVRQAVEGACDMSSGDVDRWLERSIFYHNIREGRPN